MKGNCQTFDNEHAEFWRTNTFASLKRQTQDHVGQLCNTKRRVDNERVNELITLINRRDRWGHLLLPMLLIHLIHHTWTSPTHTYTNIYVCTNVCTHAHTYVCNACIYILIHIPKVQTWQSRGYRYGLVKICQLHWCHVKYTVHCCEIWLRILTDNLCW